LPAIDVIGKKRRIIRSTGYNRIKYEKEAEGYEKFHKVPIPIQKHNPDMAPRIKKATCASIVLKT